MAAPDPDVYVKLCAFTDTTHRDVYPALDPTRPELSQEGKVIVITGASRGIGQLGLAVSFARANAKAIALIGRSADGLLLTETLVKQINPAVQLLSIAVDISDASAVAKAFDDIVAELGTPHVLINNAAACSLIGICDSDIDEWLKIYEVNIKGTYLITKSFLSKTGPTPKDPTTIISLTSGSALGVAPGLGPYAMTKIAITKFASYLQFEYPSITSVSLEPGAVPTDMGNSIPYLAHIMKDTPELVGGMAVWIASGDKHFLSGRVISVNWDVDELEEKKGEIVEGDLLTICYRGKFGSGEGKTLTL